MGDLTTQFLTRAEPGQIIRWKADAARAGETNFSAYVRQALDERGKRVPVREPEKPAGAVEAVERVAVRTVAAPSGVRVGAVQSSDVEQQRQRARELAQKDGRCTADTTKGVRCRLCGKIH